MTILTIDKKELENKIGKITSEMEERITEMGTTIEKVTDEELSVEIFPNRPDLLSVQNFARAINQFNGKKGIAKFNIRKPEKDYKLTIDKSVKDVWPYAVCAIVRGLKLNDERIKKMPMQ